MCEILAMKDQKHKRFPQAKRIKLEPKMNNYSKMEEFCERFPVLNKEILNQLDNQSLVNFKKSSGLISKVMDQERCFWIRVIGKNNEYLESFSELWKKMIHKTPVEVIKDLALAVSLYFKKYLQKNTYWKDTRFLNPAPHHIAAELGLLKLYNQIVEKTGLNNPWGHYVRGKFKKFWIQNYIFL